MEDKIVKLATMIVDILFWGTIGFAVIASIAGIIRVEIELRQQ